MKNSHRPHSFSHYLKTGAGILLVALLVQPAQTAESLVVSLRSIPDRVRKQNPDLAAARYSISEALGRLNQSGRRSNPELTIDTSHNARFREHSLTVGIAQKFPLTNRLKIEKAVSLTRLRAAEAEVRNVERELIAEAKQLTVKVLAARQQKMLIKKQSQVARELAQSIGAAAEKGERSPLDAGQAKLEAAQFKNEIHQLSAQEVTLTGQLKPLLGMSTRESLIVHGSLPELNPPARTTNPGRRPDLAAAKLNAKAAEQSAELERARRRDDIEVALTAGLERSEDAPNGLENEGIIGLGIRIPLPLWNKNEGAIQEADARKFRKKKEVEALAHNIRHEASTAHAEMTEWAKLAREISDTLLPLAEKQAEATTKAYHEGQGDIQSTLRAREQLLKLSSARLNALRDFHLARIRYQSALAR